MNRKIIVGAVLAAVAVALAWYGTVRYCDFRRDRAERRANECLDAYWKIIGDGTKSVSAQELSPVLDEMAELSEVCSEGTAEFLFARRLDGTFLIGDYAKAERMMDDLPGKSENWKNGAKAKIRAHAAIERGDKAAALVEFETFCKSLLADPESVECDPCTGIVWSYEALLARNYKRLIGLATDVGDAARAKRYREEAGKYAKIAMKKATEVDDGLKDIIAKEFADLL